MEALEPNKSEGGKLSRRRTWGLIIGFWSVFVLIISIINYFSAIYGTPFGFRKPDWWDIFRGQMIAWYPVALLTPIVLWLGQKFQFTRRDWWRALLIHLPGSLLFALAYVAISELIRRLFYGPPQGFIMSTGGAAAKVSLADYYALILTNGLPLSLAKYAIILVASYAFDYYRKFREQQAQAVKLEVKAAQLETKLIHAQLQALKMQLHPHFLFNTLHAISALMEDDIKAARRMIARLSELLRLALENVGRQEVTLRQELAALELYLEIEQIRFQDRLKVKFEIPPETLSALVPNLILQPLVENAIRHGIAPYSTAGQIEIRAQRKEGVLELQICDDGPGLPENDTNYKDGKGIGLANTRARLEQLYGQNQTLEFHNQTSGGLAVTLTMPYQPTFDETIEQETVGEEF